MRRLLVSSALLLLGAPACLLYTDPINTAPRLQVTSPATVYPAQRDACQAIASDPDGDSVQIEWYSSAGKCQDIQPGDWEAQAPVVGDTYSFEPQNHDPFCVRVLARDQHGATSPPQLIDFTPVNRPPKPMLTAEPVGMAIPLYTSVRLTPGPATDEDGDALTFTWTAVDPKGAPASLTPCDPQHEEVRCLSADQPGAYTVSIEASDRVAKQSASVTLPVLEDAAPCIEATDPVQEAPVVVLAVTERRDFEVRRVRDDGNPFPAGPHGGTAFQWFTAREGSTTWTRHLGFDRPLFEVSAALFEDARPGSSYRVRVEVLDPAHESGNDLRGCADAALCMVPDKCVRWVTWSVRFQ